MNEAICEAVRMLGPGYDKPTDDQKESVSSVLGESLSTSSGKSLPPHLVDLLSP